MIPSFASALILLKFLGFVLYISLPPGFFLYKWFTGKVSLISSIPLGLFLITVESYLVGYLGIYLFISHLLIFQSSILWVIFIKKLYLGHLELLESNKIPFLGLIFIFLSVIINSQLLVPFGKMTDTGISLFGAHFVDSTWHLALINSLNKSFPPQNPLFSGTSLTNYHYLVDLQISLLHRLSGIFVPDLFFRYFGPFYLLLLSTQIFQFAYKLTGKTIGGITALVLIMLTSNLYYIVPRFFPHAQVDPSVAWVEFFSSKVVNYPLLVSLSLLFIFMEIILINPKLSVSRSIILGLLAGAMFTVKSHTAIILITTLLFVNPISFVAALPFLFVLSHMIISSPASAIQFAPLWFIKVMFESHDHLNFPEWELRRQTLLSLNAYLGIAKLYLQGVAWFVIINFGPLIIGFMVYFRKICTLKVRLLLLCLLSSSFGLTMLFIYSSMSIVTIQFIYPVIISFGLLVSIIISRLNRFVSVLVLLLFLLLLSPGSGYVLANYQNSSIQNNISPDLVKVIRQISVLPPGVILTAPEFWSGSVIPGFSRQQLYTGDVQILDSLGIKYDSRQKQSLSALKCLGFPPQVSYILSTQPLDCYTLNYSSGNYYLYSVKIIKP